MKPRLFLGLLAVACVSPVTQAADYEITVDTQNPTVSLSPHLYGLFFEDINYGADGGLYAELIQNRSFEYYAIKGHDQLNALSAWDAVQREGAKVSLTAKDTNPIHPNNPHYLELKVDHPGIAGVRNLGFDGIRIDAGAKYDFSLYARSAGWRGDESLNISLELPDGTLCGHTSIRGITSTWKKIDAVLTSSQSADVARLVITTRGQGTLDLDMVSLFPQDTWKHRKNGLRKDLVQALQDLHPKFLRFPGGCIAHGDGLANAYRWKDTIGDIAVRKPNWNRWGYHQTYGLGYYEYMLLCEDLGMEPLPVIPIGVSCGFTPPYECVPMDKLDEWIQDSLDLIEFANGAPTTKWGSVRAKMGHPESFNLHFVCLGNEEHDTPEMRERFPRFAQAIRRAYPDIKIIGTSGLGSEIPIYDLMTKEKVFSSDEHYYESPEWFIAHQNRFDNFDRSGPKIFVGEYASRDSALWNAVAEAAYLTGVERNGDMVDMTCYAPLFANVDHTQWNPDLIYFNKRTVVRTPSYYVQQLFAQNKGDVYLSNRVNKITTTPAQTITGSVGMGSWKTAVEVDQIAVNGRKLDPAKWNAKDGKYSLENGVYVQSDAQASPAVSLSPDNFDGSTVTYTLRARKTSGDEGFIIAFGYGKDDTGYWWNVGGWGNKQHGIQKSQGNNRTILTQTPGSIETNRWYDVKVVLSPARIQCYLDGKLIHDLTLEESELSVSSTLEKSTGDVIVKLVNTSDRPLSTKINLQGITRIVPQARLLSLSGDRDAKNTLLYPDRIVTDDQPIEVARSFEHELPAHSVQFIRIQSR